MLAILFSVLPHTLLSLTPETACMDSREDLFEAWQRGGKDRPQFVRNYRETLVEHLSDGVVDALPGPNGTTLEYREFLNSYKGTVTRQLNDETDETDPQDEEVTA